MAIAASTVRTALSIAARAVATGGIAARLTAGSEVPPRLITITAGNGQLAAGGGCEPADVAAGLSASAGASR